MRVLVPRRIVGLSLLCALLCLTPVITPPAHAKPIPYEDKNDPYAPPPPSGDGDGTVVKSPSITLNNGSVATIDRASAWSTLRNYLRLMWLGYGLRWYP
jgi:hypothetical protein